MLYWEKSSSLVSSCRILSTSTAMQASNVPTLDGLSTFWRTMISAVLIIRYGRGRGLCFVISALLRKKRVRTCPARDGPTMERFAEVSGTLELACKEEIWGHSPPIAAFVPGGRCLQQGVPHSAQVVSRQMYTADFVPTEASESCLAPDQIGCMRARILVR